MTNIDPSNFIPKLLIGIGEHNHYFTLRETYLHYSDQCGVLNGQFYGNVEVRSGHRFNLSQNAHEAFRKAQEAAMEMGLELITKNVESLQEQLDEIKRASADELATRARIAAEREAKWAADRAMWQLQDIEVINAGFYPFGKFCGMAFEDINAGYLSWCASKVNDFEAGTLMRLIAEKIAADYQEYLFPIADMDAAIGEAGKRMVFTDCTVTRVASYESQYGRVYIVTMVSPDKVCIVSKSASFCEDVGKRISFKATVKAHDRYNGQMQTVVQRIALI